MSETGLLDILQTFCGKNGRDFTVGRDKPAPFVFRGGIGAIMPLVWPNDR